VPSQFKPQTLDRGAREGGHVAEMQRRRLLLAFTEVLAEDGLEDARVGRVCKRAGVSRRTFYELFEDREACFAAVLEDTVARLAKSVLPAFAVTGRWRERLRAALAVLLELFDEEPAVARVCLSEALKGGAGVVECRRRALDELIAAVDEGRSESKDGAGLPPLTAHSTVGGAVSVIHARVLEERPEPFSELLNPLMSMIVLPYLGAGASRRELDRSTPKPRIARKARTPTRLEDPFRDLPIRITFRTARVLSTIDTHPGASNRQIGDAAGVPDQGQISKLLRRLRVNGLIENNGKGGHSKGEANSWRLTDRGHAVRRAIETPAA
jgi:AcrR family transcriptional regulator